MTTPDYATISALRETLSNQIDPRRIVTEEDEFTAAAAIWNGAVDHRPSLVVRYETSADVQATSESVAAAADRCGLAAATGTVGSLGMTGLTLAGGYGPFCGSLGLAADNLLGAEVVLADGRLARADQDSHPDLLWALRRRHLHRCQTAPAGRSAGGGPSRFRSTRRNRSWPSTVH